MNTVFNHSALEYDDWFVRNEMAYRSELAAVKAILPARWPGPGNWGGDRTICRTAGD